MSLTTPVNIYNFSQQDVVQTTCCPICADVMNENESHKLTPCNHQFHTECIIQWFRMGENTSCPLCRDRGPFESRSTPERFWSTLHSVEKAAFRKYCKTKNANKPVVRAFERYLKLEKNLREAIKEDNNFRKEHKEVLKSSRQLRGKVWTTRRNLRKIAHVLQRIPIIPLNVPVAATPRRRRVQQSDGAGPSAAPTATTTVTTVTIQTLQEEHPVTIELPELPDEFLHSSDEDDEFQLEIERDTDIETDHDEEEDDEEDEN